MQILNISTTVRPSDSLSTRMFPVVDPVNTRSANLIGLGMTLKDQLKAVQHDVTVGLGRIFNIGVTLREPVLNLSSHLGVSRSGTIFNIGMTLRDTLITSSTHLGVTRSGNLKNITVTVKNVLIAHNQLDAIGVTRSASIKNIQITLV